MSYTSVIAVYEGDRTETFEQLGNGWQAAPLVWAAMCNRYLGEGKHWMSSAEEVWKLAENVELPGYIRAVLMMTFDRAIVRAADYEKAATDIDLFCREFGIMGHWPSFAGIFRANPQIPAFGWRHTSISENLFEGEWDEEKEEYSPPDWSKIWSIYDEFS